MRDCKFARLVDMEICGLHRVSTSDADSISDSFSDNEFLAALQYLKPVKAPGLDPIYPKLIIHVGNAQKS